MSLLNNAPQKPQIPPKNEQEAKRLKTLVLIDRILYFIGIGCVILALLPAANIASAILRLALPVCAVIVLIILCVAEFKWNLPQRTSQRKMINLTLLLVAILLLAWFLFADFDFWNSFLGLV
ncbi:MAG: hypothetical protein ACK5JF_06385 [Oscillospiraceae bacterium]